MKGKVAVCILMAISFANSASGGTYYARRITAIPLYSQEKGNYCGVTVIQMWTKYLKDKKYSQDTIAGYLGVKNGGGVNGANIEKGLEYYTGNYFGYTKNYSQSSAESRVIDELYDEERPLAISGTPISSNGTIGYPGMHWLLIDGVKYYKEKSYSSRQLTGVYINDPLDGSSIKDKFQYIRDNTYVGKDTLFNYWRKLNTTIPYWFSVDD